MSRSCTGAARGGFTLVELMVSLAICSVLVATFAALYSDRRQGLRAQNAPLIWSGQARAALTTLARDARQAASLSVEEGQRLLVKEPALIDYRLEEAEGGGRLLVREAVGSMMVMATHVERFHVERSGGRLEVVLDFAGSFGDYRARASHGTTVALPLGAKDGKED